MSKRYQTSPTKPKIMKGHTFSGRTAEMDKYEQEEQEMLKKAKMMAKGGEIEHPEGAIKAATIDRPDGGWGAIISRAEGGEVDLEEDEMQPEHEASIAAAIMAKRNAKRFAEGGQVDIEENAEEQPNGFYERNEEALKENYDSDFTDLSDPKDSNEMGNQTDSQDDDDLISAIRRRMKMRA